jgi:hypothetical protein
VRTDTEIANAVRHALEWTCSFPRSGSGARCRAAGSRSKGTSTTGTNAKTPKEPFATSPLFCAVSNKIEIKPSTVLPIPYDIRRSIEEALERPRHVDPG